MTWASLGRLGHKIGSGVATVAGGIATGLGVAGQVLRQLVSGHLLEQELRRWRVLRAVLRSVEKQWIWQVLEQTHWGKNNTHLKYKY